jgi:glycosyltransferase involved in cell wall biosynthesis
MIRSGAGLPARTPAMTGPSDRDHPDRSGRRLRRLLLVSHRPIDQTGGPAARWRSFARHLPEHGWDVDVVSAGGVDEFASPEKAQERARVMETAGKVADPVFRLAGLRPEALPLSTLWLRRGTAEVRERLDGGGHDAVLATGPPFAALMAARRAAGDVPLVVELRDLWAGNPAFDRGGPILRRLESWVVDRAAAVVAVTPEAAADLRRRHPRARVVEIENGFEPALIAMRKPRTPGTTILHSGTLTKDRPLAPLLRSLRPPLRLVLHGYVAPEIQKEIADSGISVEVVPPSSWEEAVRRIAEADVTLVTQSRGAGDETAVAAKVYEYLALGKPVLLVTHGGATEALLRRLGADQLAARLDDRASIERALERIAGGDLPEPVPSEQLARYERPRLAQRLAELLDGIAA